MSAFEPLASSQSVRVALGRVQLLRWTFGDAHQYSKVPCSVGLPLVVVELVGSLQVPGLERWIVEIVVRRGHGEDFVRILRQGLRRSGGLAKRR